MEIELKENSTLTVKNHSGTTLCSIDEATGVVTGAGTKLYKHHLSFDSDGEGTLLYVDVISLNSTAISFLNSRLPEIISIISSDVGTGGKIHYFFAEDGTHWSMKQQDVYYEDLITVPLGIFISDIVTSL